MWGVSIYFRRTRSLVHLHSWNLLIGLFITVIILHSGAPARLPDGEDVCVRGELRKPAAGGLGLGLESRVLGSGLRVSGFRVRLRGCSVTSAASYSAERNACMVA